MMMSFALGSFSMTTVPVSVCVPVPAVKSVRLTNSVRGCSECGVCAPFVGAQKVRLPSLLRTNHGDLSVAGLISVAAPHWQPDESTGSVRFQPLRETAVAGDLL